MTGGDNRNTERASGAIRTGRASGATAKALILEQVRAQPDGSSYDEILRELAFSRMVGRGLADADRGRTIDTDELRERVRLWQS